MPSPRRTPSLTPRDSAETSHALPLRAPRDRSFAVKHALDRIGAAVALVVVAPVLLVAAMTVKLAAGGPVVVRERRVARDGQSFAMFAFPPLPVLRRFAIDQLPQLVN